MADLKSVFGAVVPDMTKLDAYEVPVLVPVDAGGAQMIALVKRAAEAGTMINFTFHGIGGDHLSVSIEAHRELLSYLDAHRDLYWTDSFLNIMRYVKAMRQAPKLD